MSTFPNRWQDIIPCLHFQYHQALLGPTPNILCILDCSRLLQCRRAPLLSGSYGCHSVPAQTPLKSSISNWIIIFFLAYLWYRNYMGCSNADCFVGYIDSIHCPVGLSSCWPFKSSLFQVVVYFVLFLSSALLWKILITLSFCAPSFSLTHLGFGKNT